MISQSINNTIQGYFPSCEQISSTIFRCEKRYKDRVHGIYFFDISDDLPSIDRLDSFTNNYVAPSYFKADENSRWNHYYIWIASDSKRKDLEFQKMRTSIENNKDYARKYVVFESEIEDFIDTSVEKYSSNRPTESIVATWRKILSDSGLSNILTGDIRTQTVRSIRNTGPVYHDLSNNIAKKLSTDGHSTKYLSRLNIKKFGSRHLKGDFTFKKVNLIRGVNGTGKTSLLESIECLYCGTTRRSNEYSEPFRASMLFDGDKDFTEFKQLTNAEYQYRDLAWYGRKNKRGNKLYQGFARYNFFDTDASVRFASEVQAKELRELLALVALGPETSEAWTKINHIKEDIDRELTPLKNLLQTKRKALSEASKKIETIMDASPKSKALISLLRAHPFGHTLITGEYQENIPEDFFSQIFPLQSLATELNSLPKNVTQLNEVSESIKLLEKDTADIIRLIRSYDNRKSTITEIDSFIESNEMSLNNLLRLNEYISDEFGCLIKQKEEIQREILQQPIKSPHSIRDTLSNLKDINFTDKPLVTTKVELERSINVEHHKLDENQKKQQLLSYQLEAKESILISIRQLGMDFIDTEKNFDHCPLCKTEMDLQTFLKKIQKDINSLPSSKEIDELNYDTTRLTKSLSRQQKQLNAVIEAIHFTKQESISLSQAINSIKNSIADIESYRGRLRSVETTLSKLEQKGLSESEYEHLLQFFKKLKLKYSIHSESSTEDTLAALELIKKKIHNHREKSFTEKTKLDTVVNRIQSICSRNSLHIDKPDSFDSCSEILEDRLYKQNALIKEINSLPIEIKAYVVDDLKNFLFMADEFIQQANLLNAALKEERTSTLEASILQKQILEHETFIEDKGKEEQRLSDALNVLNMLTNEHSLESGLTDFFSHNFSSIQKTFSRIHVPNELQLADDHSGSLVRTHGDVLEKVNLNQISTGQRSAFVLSVFLTLNFSLVNAPPVILIDDPIAHIDDLNSLSFIDFLGNLAESGMRQIFFATANDKLANLFEKKLGFLGDELNVISMDK